MVGQPIDGIVGYSPATATNLMRYILLNTASTNTPPTSQPTKSTPPPATQRK
jgi:hypothetical protein